MKTVDKPRVNLTESNGNVYCIIAACRKAARRAGWTVEEISEVTAEMKAGNYDHALQVAFQNFEVD